MTNTDRLIATYQHHIQYSDEPMTFAVGRYTGNGASVVAALQRRGYTVVRTSHPQTYAITAAPKV